MKPEQAEIARLKREVTKLKAERDILENRGLLRGRNRREVRLYCEAPRGLAGGMVVRGARCLAEWLLCLADPAAQPARPTNEHLGARSVPASLPATGPMAPGGFRTICWRKESPTGYIGSSG